MIDQFWTFLAAITLLTLFPGVDSLLVMRNSARGGLPDGLTTSTGICCGLFVHATVSALGISAVLMQSALAFSLLKMAGGGYLLWLGGGNLWNAMHNSCAQPEVPVRKKPEGRFHWRRSLREGFVCNVFNPKTLLFYMAFLPQFINPERSAFGQALFMAAVHFIIAMIYQGVLAAVAVRISLWVRSGWCRRLADGAIGMMLLGFGLKIFLTRRV